MHMIASAQPSHTLQAAAQLVPWHCLPLRSQARLAASTGACCRWSSRCPIQGSSQRGCGHTCSYPRCGWWCWSPFCSTACRCSRWSCSCPIQGTSQCSPGRTCSCWRCGWRCWSHCCCRRWAGQGPLWQRGPRCGVGLLQGDLQHGRVPGVCCSCAHPLAARERLAACLSSTGCAAARAVVGGGCGDD